MRHRNRRTELADRKEGARIAQALKHGGTYSHGIYIPGPVELEDMNNDRRQEWPTSD